MRKHQQPANKQKQEGDAAIQITCNSEDRCAA